MDLTVLLAMAGGAEGGSPYATFIMFGAMFGILYFMVIRPQQKRMKEHQTMLSAVKRGDKVVMTGGMHGTVFEVQDKSILVEVSKNNVIKFEKGAVQSIIKDEVAA